MANPPAWLLPAIIILIVSQAGAISFDYPSFNSSISNILLYGDALSSNSPGIQLSGSFGHSVGRAVYAWPVPLYDPSTGTTASFATHFEFAILGETGACMGDGLAFFITATGPGSAIPTNSGGGWLGLINPIADGYPSNEIVAVEFDTYSNGWDPRGQHVGINVNTIKSDITKVMPIGSMKVDAWVDYDGGQGVLSVFLSYDGQRKPTPDLSYGIKLKEYLPPVVVVGFSASTGDCIEIHSLLSWTFSSFHGLAPVPAPAPAPKSAGYN